MVVIFVDFEFLFCVFLCTVEPFSALVVYIEAKISCRVTMRG